MTTVSALPGEEFPAKAQTDYLEFGSWGKNCDGRTSGTARRAAESDQGGWEDGGQAVVVAVTAVSRIRVGKAAWRNGEAATS